MAKKPGVLYAPTPKKTTKKTPTPSWATPSGGRAGMHHHLVIDRSGSMQGWTSSTINAVNAYLNDIDNHLPTTVTVELFDSNGGYGGRGFDPGRSLTRDVLCRAVVPEAATRLSPFNYQARGGTPLHDAVGYAVRDIDEMKLPTGVGVALVVMTDGQENTSKEFNGPTIASILKARQDAGWLVIYLGANQDAVAEGARFGTNMANTMSYDMQSMGLAMKSVSRSTALYASGATATASAFTDEERKTAKK